MFSIKSFFVFLSRNKLYTAINIFGFVASLTFVLLIGLYIQNQLNVDNFEKADRIYRLETDIDCTWPGPIAKDVQNRYPEVEATTRIGQSSHAITIKDQVPISKGLLFVDSTFFSMFEQKVVEGEVIQPMKSKNDVVLTKKFAQQVFSNESPIGQTIQIEGEPFVVAAVIEDIENSIIKNCEIIIRFDNIDKLSGSNYINSYNASNFATFLLLKPNTSLEGKLKDMSEHFKTYFWRFKNGFVKSVEVTPLRDAYWGEKTHYCLNSNSWSFVTILIICGLLVLVFAVINYINLSVSQTGFRAKEAATRRLLGGTKWQLFQNFVVESTLLCAISMTLAVVGVFCVIDWFNGVLNVSLSMRDFMTTENILIMISGVVILGIISGVIPASAITKFKPIQVVRGDFRRRTKMVYSKVLIGIQYLVTITLVGCALVIYRQTNYMLTADLGFDKDQVLSVSNNAGMKALALPEALKSVAGVVEVSLSQGSPVEGWNNASFDKEGEIYSFSCFMVDSVFMKMLDIEVLYATGIDSPTAVWINETAAKHMGVTRESSKIPFWNPEGLPLKGVVKDFMFNSMHENIGDMMIGNLNGNQISGSDPWNILVKIESNDIVKTVAEIGKVYLSVTGVAMGESKFLDEYVQNWYTKQKQTISLVGMLSVLAMIISTLGILAMSTYFIRQRKQEIAVRKVFGATKMELFVNLTKQFLVLISIAFIVSIPIVYYTMNWWLEEFAYKISITWDVFAIAGLVAFMIALATISWKAIQAMLANPVKSLKSE